MLLGAGNRARVMACDDDGCETANGGIGFDNNDGHVWAGSCVYVGFVGRRDQYYCAHLTCDQKQYGDNDQTLLTCNDQYAIFDGQICYETDHPSGLNCHCPMAH
jgi:hypothetical protein